MEGTPMTTLSPTHTLHSASLSHPLFHYSELVYGPGAIWDYRGIAGNGVEGYRTLGHKISIRI